MKCTVVARLRAVALAALASMSFAAPVASTTLDFESVGAGLYLSGETFDQSGFRMTVQGGSFGAVDTAAACLGLQCPGGSSGQFYYGLNDGSVGLERIDGVSFALTGFEGAYLAALAPGGPTPSPGRILINAVTEAGLVSREFEFGSSDADGVFSFVLYADPDAFDALTYIKSMSFSACTYTAAGACATTNMNLSQFALDNLQISLVPEPGTLSLLALALTGLALRARRAAA